MNLNAFRASCEDRMPEMLGFLRAMVGCNSFTANAAGVNAVARLVAENFASMGFRATSAPGPEGCGDHLFLTTSTQPGRPVIALISHLDTVFPPEEERENDFRWRPDGGRIYGPGTNDIKGGTALISLMLSAMRESAPDLFRRVNWIVALNACEETDSSSFGAACVRLFPVETAAALVFEADGGEGDRFSVVTARKGRATFTVRVEGHGAHAGSSHAEGANAIVQLADVVIRLATLTDYARDLTVNVGTIRGGTVNNRVPHEAAATLEMRAFDREVFARAKEEILSLGGSSMPNAAGHACRIFVELEDEAEPWPRNAGTDRLAEIWKQAGLDTGVRVAREARGGLSDGNVLWQKFPSLDGLGPRGGNSHCSERTADGRKEQEWVDGTSFVPKAVLNARAIELLIEQVAHDLA